MKIARNALLGFVSAAGFMLMADAWTNLRFPNPLIWQPFSRAIFFIEASAIALMAGAITSLGRLK